MALKKSKETLQPDLDVADGGSLNAVRYITPSVSPRTALATYQISKPYIISKHGGRPFYIWLIS